MALAPSGCDTDGGGSFRCPPSLYVSAGRNPVLALPSGLPLSVLSPPWQSTLVPLSLRTIHSANAPSSWCRARPATLRVAMRAGLRGYHGRCGWQVLSMPARSGLFRPLRPDEAYPTKRATKRGDEVSVPSAGYTLSLHFVPKLRRLRFVPHFVDSVFRCQRTRSGAGTPVAWDGMLATVVRSGQARA
jgi:hypothetical protein